MVFTFLIIILIAFNYILLDNQNKNKNIIRLEENKIDNSSSLTALQRENDRFITMNESLIREAANYIATIEELNGNIALLNIEREEIQDNLEHKLNILDKIKVNIEPTLFENIAKEFLSYIETGDFLAAHNLIYSSKGVKSLSLEKVKSYFNYKNGVYVVNGIEIVLGDDIENILGEIKFKMSISVLYLKRENNKNKDVVKELSYYLTYDFDDFDSNWLIKNIKVLFQE